MAASGGGRWLILGAGVVVAVAAVVAFWRPRPRLPMGDTGEYRATPDGEEQAPRLHQAGMRP